MTQPDVPIEIKVNLAAVDAAVQRLGLGKGKARSVWFLEDLTPGLASSTPLLAAGVIARLRTTDGSDDDSTVKLRPCRWSQLAPEWTTSDEHGDRQYRIEADWSGARRALAASYESSLDSGTVVEAVESGAVASLWDASQQQFVDDCADVGVNLAALTPLGPVAATRWKNVDLGGAEVDAERWELDGLDFLEVSIRVAAPAPDASARQLELEQVLRDLGATFAVDQQPKTSLVLERLVARGSGGP
jgi:hypothetical protein